ncbi:MAG: glycosyltransferase [Rickettsiales bacterium]|nr:glycosyltransferase [Rickettsiales bacterium]
MEKPLVSVIVPVYRVEKYIEKAIQSVCNQTLADIEVICVNDDSEDNSIKIVEKYAKSDDRIRILHHSRNCGVSTARNSAMLVAKSDYLMFLDPDDSYQPEVIEKMYNRIHSDDLDMVICNANIVIENSNTDARGHSNAQDYTNKDFMVVWNKIWRKSVVDQYKLKFPDGLIGEDAYFSTCYYSICDGIGTIDERLYNYLIRNDSIMGLVSRPDNEVMFDAFSISECIYNFFEKNNIREKVYKMYFGCINYGIRHFTEKNYAKIAVILYNNIARKREIQIEKDHFLVGTEQYRIKNEVFEIVQKIKNGRYLAIQK